VTRSILEALDRYAEQSPEALALDDVTYRELRAASLRVAAKFRTRVCGLGIGSRSTPKTGRASCTRTSAAAGRRDRRAGQCALPHRRPRACARSAEPTVVCVSEQSAPFAAELPGRRLVQLADAELWARDGAIAALADPPPPQADDVAISFHDGTTGRSKGAELTIATSARSPTNWWKRGAGPATTPCC